MATPATLANLTEITPPCPLSILPDSGGKGTGVWHSRTFGHCPCLTFPTHLFIQYTVLCSRVGPMPFITAKIDSPFLSSSRLQQRRGIGDHSGRKDAAPHFFPLPPPSAGTRVKSPTITRAIVLRWAGGCNIASSQNSCFGNPELLGRVRSPTGESTC